MSDDLRLRAVDEADLEVFLEQEHDPEAVRRSKFPPREREVFMAHWATRILGDPTVLVRAVIVDGELAGNIVSWWEQERRFIGYWYGRAFWGRGIGGTAMMLFLQEEKTRPLYADPYVGNTGSVRLLEKCGFQRTGTIEHGENEHIMLVLSES
ncbi:GNAT family N-acetyltransferase [Sphaerisporangium viridialbum]|uniref:GNAT family N-acetyltransferase n=1 Tax=Sphaerisporangium viridialbum TaxID=46189 RepID=UPI003C7755A4